MELCAEAKGQLEDSIIRGENKNIPGRVENRRADFAVLQMSLHLSQRIAVERVIKIVGDVGPDVFAF